VLWNSAQSRFLAQELSEWKDGAHAGPIFSDEPVKLKRGKRIDSMNTMLKGRIELYADRLEFHDSRDVALEPVIFSLENVEGGRRAQMEFLRIRTKG